MLQSIGIPGLILILVIALIIFGPSKLPEVGRAFGNTIKEFKRGTKEMMEDEENPKGSGTHVEKRNSQMEGATEQSNQSNA